VTDETIIGMLSGISRDGVDAVLVNFNDGGMDLLHASCTPYPPAIKRMLDQLLETGAAPTKDISSLLDETLGRFFARVAQDLVREVGMEMRDIHAIGSHGQNVWHQPRGDKPVTIQLGKGSLIARNTGTTVVADFRRADVKAGGQGAPLAPLLHKSLFHDEKENRAILNIGGIANLTILPARGDVSGFDCGPGNCLMDSWTKRHLRKDYDNNGNWASKGAIDHMLLERLLNDPYFKLPTPKSTGLEYFSMDWLDSHLAGSALSAGTVQTTLAELTALTVANSLQAFPAPDRLLVCGGGAHNAFLMRRMAAAMPGSVVEPTTHHGADPDWVEGLLLAWLARERLNQKPQDTRLITGAKQPVLLGEIFEPPE
jgi:anhydro-N-acetylmuramic acid kinase